MRHSKVAILVVLHRGLRGRRLFAIAVICATIVAGLDVGGSLATVDSHRGAVGSGAFLPGHPYAGAVTPDDSEATPRVIANVSVGSLPVEAAYDSGKGEVFVANLDSDNVSVISDSNNTVVATVAIANEPATIAYDSGKDEVFVTSYLSNYVSVISDETDKVITTVTVESGPSALTYDSGTGEVFVADEWEDSVSVICDGTSTCGGSADQNVVVATVTVGSYPFGAAYDDATGEVYVANVNSDNVSVICDGSTSCGGPSHKNTVVATVPGGNGPSAVAYDSGKGEIFVPNEGSDNVSVICDGSTSCGGPSHQNTVVASIAVGSYPYGVAYDSGMGEVYVANNYPTSDNVSVISDSTNTVVATVPVGSGPRGAAYDSAKGEVFVTNENSNTVSIIGVPYTLTFTETGLPSGTPWSVTLNKTPESSTGATIAFNETNGKYGYTIGIVPGYTPAQSSGSVTVSGAAVGVTVAFTQVTYTVTFTETGLPSGTTWYANITGGQSHSSTGSTISFAEPNATYDYTVATTDKEYAPTSASGSFKVNGATVSESVTFSLVTYTVTITETGVPNGTEWWVNLTNGQSFSSKVSALTFSEPNGTYTYSACAPGYSNQTSSVTVDGASPAPVTVSFTPSSPSPSGLLLLDYVIIGVVVAVVVIGVAVVLMRRRGKAPPNPAMPPSGPGIPPAPP